MLLAGGGTTPLGGVWGGDVQKKINLAPLVPETLPVSRLILRKHFLYGRVKLRIKITATMIFFSLLYSVYCSIIVIKHKVGVKKYTKVTNYCHY